MNEALFYLDASELAARIRAKAVSPVEVMRQHLDRIAALNRDINAIVTINDHALEAAGGAEAAVMREDRLGPLHGVPFTAKDSLDTVGIRTMRGSRLFANYVPDSDATAIARLKAAGAILLAKTNLPEFSFARESVNLVSGRTVNPWNFDRTPGGSSGGEGAAIAAGMSPLGIGSDVAVSIRGPAHYCGIVGLKATHGRIPITGHWPEALGRFWHVGPMARSVRDVALAFSLMSGPDGYDRYADVGPPETPEDAIPYRVRVGWTDVGFGPTARDVVAAVRRTAGTLEGLGCDVQPITLPSLERRDCNLLTAIVFRAEMGPYFEAAVAGRHAELHSIIRAYLETPLPSNRDYAAAQDELEGLRRDIAHFFEDYDVLLCPVSPVSAFPHDPHEIMVDNIAVPPRQVVRPTAPFNVTGSPAISVPVGWDADGLPIGIQLVGRHFAESTLLRVARALEQALNIFGRHPIP